MALALKVLNGPQGGDNSQRRQILQGTATLTGSYTAGGETITWTGLTQVDGTTALLNSLSTTPVWVQFFVGQFQAVTPSFAFLALYDYSSNKLRIFAAPAAATEGTAYEELAAGAYGTAYTGATLYWKAEFLSE